MFSQFKKASLFQQLMLLIVAFAIITVLYAGNWIAYGHKTIGYGLVTLFIAFMAGNAGIDVGERYQLKPRSKGGYWSAGIAIVAAIIVAAIKAYELTQ